MNADRIDYYANLLRGVPIEALGRKVREVLRDAAQEAAAEERDACAKICDRYAVALDFGGNAYVRSRDAQLAASAIRARPRA